MFLIIYFDGQIKKFDNLPASTLNSYKAGRESMVEIIDITKPKTLKQFNLDSAKWINIRT